MLVEGGGRAGPQEEGNPPLGAAGQAGRPLADSEGGRQGSGPMTSVSFVKLELVSAPSEVGWRGSSWEVPGNNDDDENLNYKSS